MRVLAFADHLSAASSGGAERVAAEVYARLGAVGDVELTVVTVLRPGQAAADVPGADVRAVPGRDLSRLVGAELLLAPGLGGRARRLHDAVRPDVLHANGLHFHGSLVAAGLARRTGTPLVTTAHLGGLDALGPRLRLAGSAWDRTLGRAVLRASHTVAAVSAAVARHVRRLGAPADRTVVAPNGVDHAVFHAADREPLGQAGSLHAVAVGRLIGNKGPQLAVEAVAAARRLGSRVRLTLVGDGPMRPRLERQARELGVAEDVSFAGHVADPTGVARHLRSADVLVRPSFTEGLPLAVLEAMATGLPVVCSRVPGSTEVVTDRIDGWHVPPGDAAALAEALAALDADRDLLRRLGRAATATAAAHTWERSAQLHENALRTAAHQPLLEVTRS